MSFFPINKVIRVNTDIEKMINTMLEGHPDRFDNESSVVRSAIVFFYNNKG